MTGKRCVILDPDQAMVLYGEVLSATPFDRMGTNAINKADEELTPVVKAKVSLNGDMKYERPKDTVEVDLSFKAILGCKVALVQAISGVGRKRDPASHGRRKYTLMPIIEAFGKKMVEVVLNETKLKDGAVEEINWNEGSEEEAEETAEPENNGDQEPEPAPEPEKESEKESEKEPASA